MTGRRGFALPMMLGILAVGSILLAGAFLMARLEAQSGANHLNLAHARAAAETGLSEIAAWWDAPQYNQLAVGDSLSIPARTLGRGGYGGRITRLSPALFEIEAEGWSQAAASLPIARHRLQSLVRLSPDEPTIRGALTVIDSANWDAASLAIGLDTIPAGWTGCSLDSAVAGVAAPPTAVLNLGCPGCTSGTPPVLVDSAITVAMLSSFGGQGYAGLAAHALISLTGTVGPIGPRVSGSQCQIADSLNWGEPRRSGPFAPCGGHTPVIYAPGNLTLTGGRGQGVLLVDGDLQLGGGMEFFGTVIVLGTVRNGPGGGSIIGGLLTRKITLDGALSASPLRIRYSACVLPISSRGSSQAISLPYRSWAQRF